MKNRASILFPSTNVAMIVTLLLMRPSGGLFFLLAFNIMYLIISIIDQNKNNKKS